jgi:hypothetical protein
MEPSATELDTFKIISNADTVDWTRTIRPLAKLEDDDWGGVLSGDVEYKEHATFQESATPMLPSPKHTPPRETFRRSMTPLPPSPKHEPQEEIRPEIKESIGEEGRHADEIPREKTFSDEKFSEKRDSEPRPPRRFVRAPVKYTAAEENEDYEIRHEKEAILNEILGFTRPPHNFKLTREWSVAAHTLDELQFELDRINSETNANSVVDMAKSGIKFGVSGIEMFLKQQGFDAADGWYTNSCKDMSKFNRPLTRLYKKYWRNTQLSPLTEMAYLLGGSLAWTIAENKMGMRKSSSPAQSAPRATAFEPEPPQPGKMRPPSNSFAASKWASAPKETEVKAEVKADVKAEVKADVKPETKEANEPKQEANTAFLEKLSLQNETMIQLLQGMQKPLPTTTISPPRSKSSSPNIRVRSLGGKRSTRTPYIVKKLNNEDESLAL